MQKPTLILLHGALGSVDQWNDLIPLLRDHFDLHAFNFAGHGGRVCQEKFSIDMFCFDLSHYMEVNQIEKAHLCGYSMGGYVALKFAALHPSMVGKIMTLGTKFDWSPEAAAKEVKMLDPEKIEDKVPHFAKLLEQRHEPLDWTDVVTQTADMMSQLGAGAAIDFSTCDIPNEIMIMVGDQDRMVKFGEAVKVSKELPNATFVPLPDTPHPIDQVDKEMLAQKIIGYFTS